MLNVAIIGCGLIGRKRAEALLGVANLTFCHDTNPSSSAQFASDFECTDSDDLDSILENKKIDALFIATRHASLASIAQSAIENGKSVFIEKPGGISKEALRAVAKLSKSKRKSACGL